jgi:hypothetical protein
MTGKEISSGERDFKAIYNRITENLWWASTELIDASHHMKTTVEIEVPGMKIINASIEFIRMPLSQCNEICGKAVKLSGIKMKDLGLKSSRLFLGNNGCSNVHLMLNIIRTGFLNYYHHSLINEGKMTMDEYNIMMRGNCIVHKLLE